MTRRPIATCLLAALLALAAPAPASATPAPPARVRLVVLVLAPYLRWEDVLSGNMPQTRALAQEASLGNLNVRSLLPDAGQPSVDSGALMLSAGTWARYDASAAAPVDAGGMPGVEYPGLPAQRLANSREAADIRLGSLGQAIEDAGGWTAAIGNGDVPGRASRPAALVAMDAAGRVRYGDVSSATLSPASSSRPGAARVSDTARVLRVFDEVLARNGGPGLVVVDAGDLSRVNAAADGEPDVLERADRVAALAALDTLVGDIHGRLPTDSLLIVAAPVAAQPTSGPSGFGPLVITGTGWNGTTTSASTHRAGLVTSADLTASILSVLGIRAPAHVAGSSIAPVPSTVPAEDRVRALERVDAFMRAVDGARPAVVYWFVLVSVLLVAACVALVAFGPAQTSVVRAAQMTLLALLAVPAASLLMYLVVYLPQTPSLVVALLLATAAVVWMVDVSTHRVGGHPRPLSVLALLTAAVILLDQWLGAVLSLDALLGYSPLVGARFYGLGNEGAALMIGGVLVGCSLVLDSYAELPWAGAARRWAFPGLAAVCVVTAAAPMLGANVGVAVWGTIAFGLAWWGMLGRRVGWRLVLGLLLLAALLVASFAVIDGARGDGRTHLAQSIATAREGGVGEIRTLLARKASTGLRVSVESGWGPLALVLLGALAYVRLRPRGLMRDLLNERPSFAAALTAALIAAAVSLVTEDSGVIVPALLLLFPAVAAVYLLLGSSLSAGAGNR